MNGKRCQRCNGQVLDHNSEGDCVPSADVFSIVEWERQIVGNARKKQRQQNLKYKDAVARENSKC